SDLIITSHEESHLIFQARGFAWREPGEGETRTVRLEVARHLHQGVPRKGIFNDQPRNGKVTLISDFGFNRNGIANFQHIPVARPAGRELVDPRAGKESAQGQDSQQHVHRINEQAQFEQQAQHQEPECAENPFHPDWPPAGICGTGTVFRISSRTTATVRLRNRLSGRRISRWPSTYGATCFTSSGRTKSNPWTAARACAQRSSAML